MLFQSYHALVRHMNKLYKTRIPYTMLEQVRLRSLPVPEFLAA